MTEATQAMPNTAYQLDTLKTRQAGLPLIYTKDSSETSTDISTLGFKNRSLSRAAVKTLRG